MEPGGVRDFWISNPEIFRNPLRYEVFLDFCRFLWISAGFKAALCMAFVFQDLWVSYGFHMGFLGWVHVRDFCLVIDHLARILQCHI